MASYTVTLTDNDIKILDVALGALAFRSVAPLIARLNKEIDDQKAAQVENALKVAKVDENALFDKDAAEMDKRLGDD